MKSGRTLDACCLSDGSSSNDTMILETVAFELLDVNTNGITSRRREEDVTGSVPRSKFCALSPKKTHSAGNRRYDVNNRPLREAYY